MRNIIRAHWGTIGEGVSYWSDKAGLHVRNTSLDQGALRISLKRNPADGWYRVEFDGTIDTHTAGPLYAVNENNHVLGESVFGSSALAHFAGCKELALYLVVPPSCDFTVTNISVKRQRPNDNRTIADFCKDVLTSRVAVVVPTYPTLENKYPCAFVHTRVKAYKDMGIPVDVICAFDTKGYTSYSFEGVNVLRVPIDDLGHVFARKAYDAVFLHFFDAAYARAIEGNGLGRTQFFLWSHNPETIYWDFPAFATPYFSEPITLTDEQIAEFTERDAIIKRFCTMPNISWVFISDSQRKRAEQLIGVEFPRVHIIPNVVDEKAFPYTEKDPALRYKVFNVRKFEDVATYALDIDVACVLELSKRPCFAHMTFDFFGDGPLFETLLAPVKDFENVHLHRTFLAHEQIAEQHANHGIALFATRFDSQGVSMCEAAQSGLAVVSSDIDAANYFLPNDMGLLCEVENPVAYADVIEKLVEDPAYFAECSRACHEKVNSMCNRRNTIGKEIDLLKSIIG